MPATPPTQGCRMRYRSPYGPCGLPHPHPHPHYHMYYPHPRHMSPPPPMWGPPRHMMPPLHPSHRHPHMNYVRSPMMPAYPTCYPYQHNMAPFMGSPRTPTPGTPGTHSWNQYKHAMQKSVPQRYVILSPLLVKWILGGLVVAFAPKFWEGGGDLRMEYSKLLGH